VPSNIVEPILTSLLHFSKEIHSTYWSFYRQLTISARRQLAGISKDIDSKFVLFIAAFPLFLRFFNQLVGVFTPDFS
jgi:hypothetical protein